MNLKELTNNKLFVAGLLAMSGLLVTAAGYVIAFAADAISVIEYVDALKSMDTIHAIQIVQEIETDMVDALDEFDHVRWMEHNLNVLRVKHDMDLVQIPEG